MLWHLRFGHLHVNRLKLLSRKEMVSELPKIDSIKICEGCIYRKQSRKLFPIGKSLRAKCCFDLVHADLCGSMNTESLGGSKYFLMILAA